MLSIAHWLDTFTCSKYADRFERSGYQNLQSVCQLTTAQLQTLGIANHDICTIMENISLLKQSAKSINNPPRYLDLNSEPPSSTGRSRTASPAINTLNRTLSQTPTAYSPRANVSTPPASSGPSPDRVLPGPPSFDSPAVYHRSNSYPNPVNPNTFFDISPSSSASSPHRSTSIDTLPPPMEPTPFNDYLPQPPPHQFQPPGMMYRGGNPVGPGHGPGPGYYNQPPPRFYSPEHLHQHHQQQQQQQQLMYSNQRMMMHPQQQQQQQQQHPLWGAHRLPLPPPPSSHSMHYHPYDHHQFRMASSQQFFHPNHPIMSDQNQMFINQQQQQNMNPSTSNKLSTAGEPHPHPLQSLERLVLLPESQVIDPKSVVNEIHDPQSPFSESLSPYGTSSPKNAVSTPPAATIVSNLLTNEKSIHEQHAKTSSGLKRSSTHDERNDLNKKNRLNTSNDLNTNDSIINNHPVVTSLLTRGLNNSTSQAPLPSIKSLQQKHNPSFIQQQQQMIFPPSQPDPQQFVDGLVHEAADDEMTYVEQDYEQLITGLRLSIDITYKQKKSSNSKSIQIPSQLDGVSDTTGATSKSPSRASRKRDLSTSSERGTSNSENRSTSPVKPPIDKSNSDPIYSSHNGAEGRRNGSLNHHHKSSKRRLSENNLELNHSTNGHHSNSTSSKIHKPKVMESPSQSNIDHEITSSAEVSPKKVTTHHASSKPIREAKKRSLIYTGNTREFLETAIAAGLMEDIGDEEDEDNEYVPPGGTVPVRRQDSPSSSSDNEEESAKNTDESGSGSGSDNDEDEDEENNTDENDVDEKNSGDEMVINETPSESGINWNVRNRPQRQTHLIRFDNISKQDEQQFFGALQEQVPELAAYLNEDSDDEYQIETKETNEDRTKSSRKTSIKRSQRTQIQSTLQQDEQTVEIIKKFRHVNVPSVKKPTRKSHTNESTTISNKNRSDELYVVLDENSPRTIVSGAQLDTTVNTKKTSTIQSFNFHRRPMKINVVEDSKAQWRCILCWNEPYEEYLGPLFGPFQLNEQCHLYFNNNKQLAKHYRKLKEVWLHRDCALWNNHIQMNPTTGELMHVPDACSTYLDITCSVCQIPGAALACRYRNCKIRYHYPCAKTTADCRLIEESYSVYCPKHNQMNNNKSKKPRQKKSTNVHDSQDISII